MESKHKYDRDGRAFEMGKNAETLFENFITEKGWTFVKSSFSEDIRHIDGRISKDGKTYTVDIKAEKRVSRADATTSNEKIWLELKSGNGSIGWVYSENTDLIAFQDGEQFLVIPRDKLATKMESLLTNNYVSKSYQALYNLYSRWGREDLLTQVLKTDVEDLSITL